MQLGSVRYDIAQENAVNLVLRCGAAPFLDLDRDQSYRICQTTAASSALGPRLGNVSSLLYLAQPFLS